MPSLFSCSGMETTEFTTGAVVFPGFELLDVFGPLEMLGLLDKKHGVSLKIIAENRGEIASAQGPRVVAEAGFSEVTRLDLILVPGGKGTREQVNNPNLIDFLKLHGSSSTYVASVCTGSALLAKAGLLDQRRATSNKMAFDWVKTQGEQVEWIRKARWVQDGKFFTSSGVSAGMDMTLALIESIFGREAAILAAKRAEYIWQENPDEDPFA